MLRLFFYNFARPILTLVDTGFTMEVLMENSFADEAGLKYTGAVRTGLLATGRIQNFVIRRAEIEWFGRRTQVEVDVPIWDDDYAPQSQPPPAPSFANGQTIAIIGTKLLRPNRLEINFMERTLSIVRLED